jgi:hypothetical protein
MLQIEYCAAIAFYLLVACQNNRNQNSSEADITASITEVTHQWNNSIIQQDVGALEYLYAKEIVFYGSNSTRWQVLSAKEQFFKQYPDFNQSIKGRIEVVEVNANEYHAIFPKRTTFGGKTIDVTAKLAFIQENNKWLISAESDQTTEANLSQAKSNRQQSYSSTNSKTRCMDVVFEIIKSSPEHQQRTNGLYEAIVKNGGTSYGFRIEGSPNPKEDKALGYAENYQIAMHESYPDHIVTIQRYEFDPIKKQLYEVDARNLDLIPIDFDRALLSKYDNACR